MTFASRFVVFLLLGLGTIACGGSDNGDDDDPGNEPAGGAPDGTGGTSGGSDGTNGGTSGGSNGTNGGTGGTNGGSGGNEPVAGTGGTAPEPPPPSTFSCEDLEPEAADVTERSCFDFNDGSTSGWEVDGGEWAAVDGTYEVTGPAEPASCPETGSLITASLAPDISAANVRVSAQLTDLERADKVLVLRSRDSGNRIELNFRSFHDDEGVIYGGDLVVQELVDCMLTTHVLPQTVEVPHELAESLVVDVELRGTALTVVVGGETVFEDEVPVSIEPGGVGFGVITSGVARFDDLVVEVLE